MKMNSEENQSLSKAQPADSDSSEKTQGTDQRLHHAPLSKIHYFAATATGLIAPFVLVQLYTAGGMLNDLLFFLLLFLATVYLFHTFKMTLLTRFNFGRINVPTQLLFGSLAIYAGSAPLSLLFLHHYPMDLDFATATFFEKSFYYASILGLFGLSSSLILISFELVNLPHNLYGLRHPLRLTMLLLSLVLLIVTLAIIIVYLARVSLFIALSFLILATGDLVILVMYGLNSALLSLVFLFAAFRDPAHPAQSDK
jgi:hypothetical protein